MLSLIGLTGFREGYRRANNGNANRENEKAPWNQYGISVLFDDWNTDVKMTFQG